jgi:hypothetical protein
VSVVSPFSSIEYVPSTLSRSLTEKSCSVIAPRSPLGRAGDRDLDLLAAVGLHQRHERGGLDVSFGTMRV